MVLEILHQCGMYLHIAQPYIWLFRVMSLNRIRCMFSSCRVWWRWWINLVEIKGIHRLHLYNTWISGECRTNNRINRVNIIYIDSYYSILVKFSWIEFNLNCPDEIYSEICVFQILKKNNLFLCFLDQQNWMPHLEKYRGFFLFADKWKFKCIVLHKTQYVI